MFVNIIRAFRPGLKLKGQTSENRMTEFKTVLLFLVKSVCSPVLFLVILISGFDPLGMFTSVGGNTDQLSLLKYAVVAGILYALWIWVHSKVFPLFKKEVSMVSQINQLKWWSMIPYLAGAWNILAWVSGMEGNVFGFIFFPILALASLYCIVSYVVFFVKAKPLADPD